MSQLFQIDCSENLPGCDVLVQLLAKNEALSLKYDHMDFDYIDTIVGCLPDHHVSHTYSTDSVQIWPAISTQSILDNSKEICACAASFRQDAIEILYT